MKTVLSLWAALALAICVDCAKDFKFGSPTCVDVVFDAKFTLTDGEDTVTFNQDNFTVKAGLCANETESSMSNIRLENWMGDALTLTFTKKSNSSVTLNTLFYFSPNDFFNTTTDTGINADDIGTTDLAAPDEKFECNSPQMINFSPQGVNTKNYTLSIVLSNVQMQGFDMKNGQFSNKVSVCQADVTTAQTTNASTEATTIKTSEAPTTKATSETTATTVNATTTQKSNETTTEPAKNTSSAAPTTSPVTTAPTTTVPPTLAPPSKLTYMYPKDKPCIIMEGSFQLKIKYEKKDNKSEEKYINFPSTQSDVVVTGSCPNGTKSSLTLTFGKENAKRTLTYNFAFDKNSKASVESWKAKVDLDSADFPNATETTLDVAYNDTVELSPNTMYYQCLALTNFGKDPLTFITKDFKVQAFNVTDNKFADDGIDCEADVNPTPNPSAPPTNTYSLTKDQNTCLVFKAGIQFTIPYVSNKGNTTEIIALPTNYDIDGSCNMTGSEYYTQQLVITFYDAWKLTMDFTSDVKNAPANLLAAATPTKYYVSNVNLDYDINSNLFIDAAPTEIGKKFSVQSKNLSSDFLSASASKSYLCKADTSVDINGVTMTTKNLQYQAFKSGNTTAFADASECSADDETNSVVPIAVGAALAGLVIIVLIAYLIGRKRSRSGYEQV